MHAIKLFGVHTALVSPMNDGGQLSHDDLAQLIETQINEGIHGLVSVGTTGESPTLTPTEHIEVIRQTVQQVNGRVPVIAGTGSNHTQEAIAFTRQADQANADGFLLVAPYYNKPSQEGLVHHFSQVAAVTEKPIILYSIPSRCGIAIAVDTVAQLHERCPHICAIKEAGGDADRVSQLRQTLGERFVILSGDDSLTLPFMAVGAQGVISVASNLIVKDLVKMVDHALNNDFATAEALHRKYFSLFKHLFIEPNPVAIKEALYQKRLIHSKTVRLPLCAMKESNRTLLLQTLDALNP